VLREGRRLEQDVNLNSSENFRFQTEYTCQNFEVALVIAVDDDRVVARDRFREAVQVAELEQPARLAVGQMRVTGDLGNAVTVRFGQTLRKAVECNLLEEDQTLVTYQDNWVTFPIKTFKIWFCWFESLLCKGRGVLLF
jgi:hypothetical protein